MSDRSSTKSERKVFPCYFCVKTFKLKGCLETHVIRQHPGNAVSQVSGGAIGWPAWTSDPSAIQELFEAAANFRRRGCTVGFRYRDCPQLLCDAIAGAVGARTNDVVISESSSSVEGRVNRTQQWLGAAPSSVASLESFTYYVQSPSSTVLSSSAQSQGSMPSTVDSVALENAPNDTSRPPQEVSIIRLSSDEIDELLRLVEEPQLPEDF